MQKRWGAMAAGTLLLIIALTGAAFAATSGEVDVLQQFRDLRQTHMEQKQQLHEAQKAEMTALVDQALADGTITEEQAARLTQPKGRSLAEQKAHLDGRRQKLQVDKEQLMLRQEQMKAQRGEMMRGAKRPMLPLMTEEELRERLAVAVESGRLTQEQADQMLERHLNWQAQQENN